MDLLLQGNFNYSNWINNKTTCITKVEPINFVMRPCTHARASFNRCLPPTEKINFHTRVMKATFVEAADNNTTFIVAPLVSYFIIRFVSWNKPTDQKAACLGIPQSPVADPTPRIYFIVWCTLSCYLNIVHVSFFTHVNVFTGVKMDFVAPRSTICIVHVRHVQPKSTTFN